MAKVFISYSKRDYMLENGLLVPGNVIDIITNALSNNGISYWIDREGLDAGVTYAEHIAKNIKDCDVFLFLDLIQFFDGKHTVNVNAFQIFKICQIL